MKNSLFKKAIRMLTNNIGLKLLAVIVSCGLWFVENAGSRKMLMMGRRGRINLEQNLSRDVSIRKYAAAISGL